MLGCVMQLFFSLGLLFPTYDKICVLVIYFELNDKIVRRSDSNTNYSKRQDTKKGRKFLIPSLIRLYNLSYFSGVQLLAMSKAATGQKVYNHPSRNQVLVFTVKLFWVWQIHIWYFNQEMLMVVLYHHFQASSTNRKETLAVFYNLF